MSNILKNKDKNKKQLSQFDLNIYSTYIEISFPK